jgi:hypothetical protein
VVEGEAFGEYPATFEQIRNMERASVWSGENVEERVRYHYLGQKSSAYEASKPFPPHLYDDPPEAEVLLTPNAPTRLVFTTALEAIYCIYVANTNQRTLLTFTAVPDNADVPQPHDVVYWYFDVDTFRTPRRVGLSSVATEPWLMFSGRYLIVVFNPFEGLQGGTVIITVKLIEDHIVNNIIDNFEFTPLPKRKKQ